MSSNRTNTGIEPATLTIRQAASIANVSLRTLLRWLGRGIVPGVIRQGRVVRIHKQSFDRWLQSGAK